MLVDDKGERRATKRFIKGRKRGSEIENGGDVAQRN